MQVILAQALGMCFGVRDALQLVAEVERPEETTIHGELVHNDVVLQDLQARGFRQTDERERTALPQTAAVLITAHGISDARRLPLLQAGKQLIDTTCPLVRRVHAAAQQLELEGYHVLILGKPGHVEVQGVVEDLQSCHVIGRVEDVIEYSHDRLGIVCQTTLPSHVADDLLTHVQLFNPLAEIRFVDTICEPTRQRQRAMRDLVERAPAVVVVGGKRSNNTLQLVAFCHERGVPAVHVESAAELDAGWLAQFDCVGLTAGTSTLDRTIAEVYRALVAAPQRAPLTASPSSSPTAPAA